MEALTSNKAHFAGAIPASEGDKSMNNSPLKLQVGWDANSLKEIQDCIILIKWRSSHLLETHERARLTAPIDNFQIGNRGREYGNLCVKEPWELMED